MPSCLQLIRQTFAEFQQFHCDVQRRTAGTQISNLDEADIFLLNSFPCVIIDIIKCNKSLTDIVIGLINVIGYGSVDNPCFNTSSSTRFQNKMLIDYDFLLEFPFQLLQYEKKLAVQVNMYSKIIFTVIFNCK